MTAEVGTAELRGGAGVVVVGGGVIGLACAWRAASQGLDVTLIDAGAERPAASDVAAGMLAPIGEASWGEERLLRLGVASAARWQAFAAELEAAAEMPVPYRRCGSLHIALDRDEAAELQRRYALQGGLGEGVEWLSASRCRELEPGLAPIVAGAIHVPDEAEVDPRALLAALRRACERVGVRRLGAVVAKLERSADGVHGARLADGEVIAADEVVLAAGAWSGLAATELPVRPVAGETVRLRATACELPCERIVVSERVYVVPRAGGEVVLGASVEERGFDARVKAGGVHELLREAYRALPEIAELELLEFGAGLRPGTPDNAPILGRAEVDGLILANGHYRNGILLAPITADGVAALLRGEPAPSEFDGLGPERFAVSTPRERALS